MELAKRDPGPDPDSSAVLRLGDLFGIEIGRRFAAALTVREESQVTPQGRQKIP